MAPPPIKNVIVVGASGSVGPPIVDALLASNYTVSVLSRATSSATFAQGVRVIKSDYTPESLVDAFQGQDAVVSTIAAVSPAEQIKLVDAAITAKVRRFFPSEYGVDTSHPDIAKALPRAALKTEVVQCLISKQDTGLSWTGLVVGAFFDWGLSNGAFLFDVAAKTATVLDGGNAPTEGTNVAQIGRAVAHSLAPEHFDETANHYVYVNSFTTTQNEVLSVVEGLYGFKFERTNLTTEAFWQDGYAKVQGAQKGTHTPADAGKGVLQMIVAEFMGRTGVNNYSTKGLWNQRLGLPQEDLKETVKEVLAKKKL